MQRRGGSGAQTTASRIKTLQLYVQAKRGRAEADAFLLRTKLDRDYLDDETRLIPVELWHAALVAFTTQFGRDAISQTVPHVVATENLGVWTHVLRGATGPSSAFEQLDRFGVTQIWTERWRTLEAGAGVWRGAIRLPEEAHHEADGLCLLARAAELASVPMLFGLQPGVVKTVSSSRAGEAAFEVHFQPPGAKLAFATGGVAACLGIVATLGRATATEAALDILAATASGALAGLVVGQERKRRAQSRAQLVRIHALERAATLRERREQTATSFAEGLVIAGKYRLAEKLGVGANGTIWEAERLADGSLVALKLLRAAVAHDGVAADRLRREAAALGLAWHPNVVEVYEDGHLPDGTSYLVMERLYGESLAARLKRVGALTPQALIPVAVQVVDALGAVHAAGIIHRDVKPSNIFLVQEPPENAGRVKLLDFGVARVEWAETRLTNANARLGTPGYMSPEQEQGLEIDHRADFFGLGAVMYECLTGIAPPLETSELWRRSAHEDSMPSGVQRALQGIPADFRRVIERATAPLPQDRFPDARTMRDALLALAHTDQATGSA